MNNLVVVIRWYESTSFRRGRGHCPDRLIDDRMIVR
jgi:hypothetical protein